MAIQTVFGGITCSTFIGQITRQRHQGETAHRLGRGDVIAQSLGKRGDLCRCAAMVVCADLSTAKTTADSFHALNLETAITVTDDLGRTLRVAVDSALASIRTGKFGYGGTSYPYCVVCELMVEDVGDAPTATTNVIPA